MPMGMFEIKPVNQRICQLYLECGRSSWQTLCGKNTDIGKRDCCARGTAHVNDVRTFQNISFVIDGGLCRNKNKLTSHINVCKVKVTQKEEKKEKKANRCSKCLMLIIVCLDVEIIHGNADLFCLCRPTVTSLHRGQGLRNEHEHIICLLSCVLTIFPFGKFGSPYVGYGQGRQATAVARAAPSSPTM